MFSFADEVSVLGSFLISSRSWAGFYLLKDGELVLGASGLTLRFSHYFARPSLKKILAILA